MSFLEGIDSGLVIGVVLGVILTFILEHLCHNWGLQSREALLRSYVYEYNRNLTVLERDSRALALSRVRTPSITDEDNPRSRSQRFGVVAEVYRADESPGASSSKEGAPSASPSPKQKRKLSYRKRGRSRVSSSQKRSDRPSSRKRRSKSCSPDKIFERSPEPSVRIRRSARIAAGSSSQPQSSPPTLLTEEGAYGTFDRSQEVEALSPSPSRPSHTSCVTRPSRVLCTVSPSTSLRSTPSSLPRPIRAPAQLTAPTPSPTVPPRTTTPKELAQVPSSSESSRRGVPERMCRICASKGSSRPLRRSLEERLRSPLSGGPRTKPPLSPRASARLKDETPTTPAKLHGDSDEMSDDDEDAS